MHGKTKEATEVEAATIVGSTMRIQMWNKKIWATIMNTLIYRVNQKKVVPFFLSYIICTGPLIRVFWLINDIYFSLQEERRSLARAAIATSQEAPFGLYGPPAAYAPGYF